MEEAAPTCQGDWLWCFTHRRFADSSTAESVTMFLLAFFRHAFEKSAVSLFTFMRRSRCLSARRRAHQGSPIPYSARLKRRMEKWDGKIKERRRWSRKWHFRLVLSATFFCKLSADSHTFLYDFFLCSLFVSSFSQCPSSHFSTTFIHCSKKVHILYVLQSD